MIPCFAIDDYLSMPQAKAASVKALLYALIDIRPLK